MNRFLRHIKRYFFLGFIFCLLSSFQNQYDTNAKIKTLFIYNFAKYIEWPADYKKGNFKIGVLGDSPIYDELIKVSEEKKVFNQTIEIVKYSSPSEIKKCHMMVVPSAKNDQLSACIEKTKSYSTLVITESKGSGTSSGINFVVLNNKQKFQLNKSNIAKRNLKVSNNLLALAIVIE